MKAQDLFDVSGLVTIVTGAASGIGLALATVMAENGALVTLVDIQRQALDDAISALHAQGIQAHADIADVTDAGALKMVFDRVVARHGKVDVVFANAGISGGPGFLTGDGERNPNARLEDFSEELWDRVLATNLSSVFKTLQIASRQMKSQASGGRIIVTGSISATRVETYVGLPYVTSKAGVAQLVRQAAFELAKYNILVNAIAPGPVITNIGGGRLREAAARAPFEKDCPMHRLATPEDIQGAALFLASRASSFITGTQIVIDGGVTLGIAD